MGDSFGFISSHPSGNANRSGVLFVWALLGGTEGTRPTVSSPGRTPSLAGEVWP